MNLGMIMDRFLGFEFAEDEENSEVYSVSLLSDGEIYESVVFDDIENALEFWKEWDALSAKKSKTDMIILTCGDDIDFDILLSRDGKGNIDVAAEKYSEEYETIVNAIEDMKHRNISFSIQRIIESLFHRNKVFNTDSDEYETEKLSLKASKIA